MPSSLLSAKWVPWHTLVWLAWLLFFGAYELWAGVDARARTPMLTQATVRYIPSWITLPFIVWLFVHFAVRYFNASYVQNLHRYGIHPH